MCQKGYKDETEKIESTKCINNFHLIFSDVYDKNICNENCEYDEFKKMIIVINVMIPNLEVQDVLEKVVVNI